MNRSTSFASCAALALCALPAAGQELSLTPVGIYASGADFATGGAEIVAWRSHADASGQRVQLFVVNGAAGAIDVVDLSDPVHPVREARWAVPAEQGFEPDGPTHVAVDPRGRGVAVSVPAADKTRAGRVVFLDFTGTERARWSTGALPDYLTFTPDGRMILVANEGEAAADYSADPEGSVTLVDLSKGLDDATAQEVGFSGVALHGPVRIFGPHATPEQDLEPESIAVTSDGRRAFVVLQENNAVAVLDLRKRRFEGVWALGVKDHSRPGMGLDPSFDDGGAHIAPWPVEGLFQPDHAALLKRNGRLFLLTANEGDARDDKGFSEEAKVGKLTLDPQRFPDAADLQKPEALGNLKVSTVNADDNGDGLVDHLYAFGARSIAVWDAEHIATPLWDSGDTLERTVAERMPALCNADNEGDQADARSRSKGPEPEGLVMGTLRNTPYVFVGMERPGAIAAFDVSDPQRPVLAGFVSTATPLTPPAPESAPVVQTGRGPEGLAFIPAAFAPGGKALLLVANEISGTVDIIEVVRE